MQKITVVGYNRDVSEPVTEEEIMDELAGLGLSDVHVLVQEMDTDD